MYVDIVVFHWKDFAVNIIVLTHQPFIRCPKPSWRKSRSVPKMTKDSVCFLGKFQGKDVGLTVDGNQKSREKPGEVGTLSYYLQGFRSQVVGLGSSSINSIFQLIKNTLTIYFKQWDTHTHIIEDHLPSRHGYTDAVRGWERNLTVLVPISQASKLVIQILKSASH